MKKTATAFVVSAMSCVVGALDAGVETWQLVGPVGGNIRSLASVAADPPQALAAVARSGLYRSTDDAQTWNLVTTDAAVMDVYGIAVSASNPDVIYANAHLPTGRQIVVSRDAGATWTETGQQGSVIVAHPNAAHTVYAGFDGLWRSEDFGETWTTLGSFSNVKLIAVHPTHPAMMLVFENGGAGPGVYLSTDAGALWRKLDVFDSPVTALAFDPNDSQHILVGGLNSGVQRSIDGGASFEDVSPSAEASDTVSFAFDPDDALRIWFATPDSTYRSDDGGETWGDFTEGLTTNVEIVSLIVTHGLSSTAVVGTVEGAYAFDEALDLWQAANQGFAGVPAWNSLSFGGDSQVWLTQFQTSLLRSEDSGRTWSPSGEGLNGAWVTDLAVHPVETDRVFAGTYFGGGLYRSTDRGLTWARWGEGLDGEIHAISMTAGNPEVMRLLRQHNDHYAKVYESTDGGRTWEQIFGTNTCCFSLAVAPHDSDLVFAGGNGGLFRSENGGENWRKVIESSFALGLGDIEFDPVTPGRMYVAGYDAWISDDWGLTWSKTPAWLTGSTAIVADHTVADSVYITQTWGDGVLRSQDGGVSFEGFSSGLPARLDDEGSVFPVGTDLEVTPDKSGMLVSTKVGLYHLKLAAIESVSPGSGPTSGGTRVNISGGIFREGTRVFFGNLEATEVVVISETTAIATTPPHAEGDVHIQVVMADGRIVTADGAFRYSDEVTIQLALDPASQVVFVGDQAGWTVSLDGQQTADVAVAVSPSAPDVLELPNEVVIPAGQTSAHITGNALREAAGLVLQASLPEALGGAETTARLDIMSTNLSYAPESIVPGLAWTPGSEASFFRSSLWITNPHGSPTVVRLRFVPAIGQNPGGGLTSIDLPIGSMQSAVFHDVLPEVFGVTEHTFGCVVVEVAQGLPKPVISARTYNDSPQGTYGQYIEAVGVPPADAAAPELLVVGLGGKGRYRSNLGVVNLSRETLNASLVVEGADGSPIGEAITVTIPAEALAQVSRINHAAGAGPQDIFNVRVTGDQAFFAYGSMLDNETSDPIFVPATLVEGNFFHYGAATLQRASGPQYLDGTALAAGAAGTFFRTSLVASNFADSDTRLVLRFWDWQKPIQDQVIEEVVLSTGQTIRYEDALTEIFGLTEGVGTLLVQGYGLVSTWSRTYNDPGGEGTYGQFIPPLRFNRNVDAIVFHGLSENWFSRTNMGAFVNAAQDTEMTVKLFTKDGDFLGQKRYPVTRHGYNFWTRFIRDFDVEQLTDGFMIVAADDLGAVAPWISSVDNRSSDQTFMRPMWVLNH